MSHPLINRSPDLQRLRADGFDISIRSAYLVMNDVPYVNARREVAIGILVAKLNLAGDVTARPDTHVAYFVGETPCHADGTAMNELFIGGAITVDAQLTANHTFSQKPPCGYYEDYYAQLTTYAAMLVGQAQLIVRNATAQGCRVEAPEPEDASPHVYIDTASSRADINIVSRKLANQRVAIVGLGGTGSYVLDFVTKTLVKEIHTYEPSRMRTHNAFRSPGAASIEQLRQQPTKSAYFKETYANIHTGIVAHDIRIDASNVEQLRDKDFVFLCIDLASAKAPIIAKLREWGVPFVDVGLGLYLKGGALGGVLRVTGVTAAKSDHVESRISMGVDERAEEYDSNIQIAELNAYCAVMAVTWWKKHFGFYADFEKEHFTTYSIESNMLVSEDAA